MTERQNDKPVGDMVRSLASMSLCKYRSSAHLLKLTRTSVKLTGKLVCDVTRFVSRIIVDDVISDVIRPRSTIREDHIQTPYRGTLCSSIVQFWQELSEKKHFKDKSVKSLLWRHPVTWRHREYAQLIAHRQVPIGCTLKLSGLVSEIFSSKVATMIIRNHVMSDVKRSGSTIREDHIDTPYREILC